MRVHLALIAWLTALCCALPVRAQEAEEPDSSEEAPTLEEELPPPSESRPTPAESRPTPAESRPTPTEPTPARGRATPPRREARTTTASEDAPTAPPATRERRRPSDGAPPRPTIYEPPAGASPGGPPPAGPISAHRAEEGSDDPEESRPPSDDPERHTGRFYFGSYGRIIVASDLEGRLGRFNGLTTWGPRVDEDDTYAEIELRREDRFLGLDTRIVATIAYAGPLFHLDGEFSEAIAIRNLFAETTHVLTRGLNFWAGSRMWRGDDVYLYNFWPLDNLNMIGGGGAYAIEDIGELSLAVGLAQPNDPFQRQEVLVPARAGFSPETVVFLDRPRVVAAGRFTYWPFGRFESTGMKGILYGEVHHLPSGERRREEGALIERLPSDFGWVAGAQVGGYISAARTFANLFFRYGRGLGAYDPLGVPFQEGSVIQTGRAEEVRIALSANWEYEDFGLMLGAYWRYFRDADPNVFDRGAMTEGSIALRPHVWFGEVVGAAVDVSYQGLQTTALDERTGQPEGGHVFKLALMPFISPFGRGTYTRPHIRVIYSLTVRDDGARNLYPALDPRFASNIEHFLGIGVEWWFSSTSYGF